MSISLRISDKESKLIKEFAELYGESVSEYIRRTVMERIEDEYDLKCANEAIDEYKSDPVTYSMDEVAKHLGIKKD